jgi:hypothetical protein
MSNASNHSRASSFAQTLSPVSTTVTHNEKEALMRMIAQEMVKSFVDPSNFQENDDLLQDRFEKTLQHKSASRRAAQKGKNAYHQIEEDKTVSDDSFGGLTLGDLGAADRPPSRPQRCRSRADRDISSNGDESSKPSKPNSKSKAASSSKFEDELSIDEIRNYVMNNIPQAVRDQIPQEAWGKIFGGSNPKASSRISRNELQPAVLDQEDYDNAHLRGEIQVDYDDQSVVSALTSAFPDGKSVESKQSKLLSVKYDEKDEVLLPLLTEISEEASQPSSSVEFEGSTEKPKQQRSKGVAFGHIEVRYYERIPCDNPAVLNGCAIGIGWRYKRGGKATVDFWENKRGTPLRSWEMVLDRKERERILRNAGHAKKDIADTIRVCLKGKNNRQQTVNNLPVAGLEEAVEKARGKVSRMVKFGRKKSLVKK